MTPLSRRTFLRLKKLQAVAGLWFLTFLITHVANAGAFAVGGPDTAARFLEGVRSVTGSIFFEVAWVLAPVALHGVIGALLLGHERALRRRGVEALLARGRKPPTPSRRPRRAPSARLHRLTGFSLLVLVPLHVTLVRFGAFLGEAAPGYSRAQALVDQSPVLGLALLGALALCASYHVGYGLWMALVNLRVLRSGRARRVTFRAGLALSAVMAATLCAALIRLARG